MHVQRFSRLARNTIYLIAAGKTAQPSRRTLDRLAFALATAPRPPYRRDQEVEQQIMRELYRAAGYAPPVATDEPTSLLETALTEELGSRPLAVAWAARIRELRALEIDAVRRLEAPRSPPP